MCQSQTKVPMSTASKKRASVSPVVCPEVPPLKRGAGGAASEDEEHSLTRDYATDAALVEHTVCVCLVNVAQ